MMGTSNLDPFILSFLHSGFDSSQKLSDIQDHPCKSSTQVSGALKIQVPSSAEQLKVGNGEDNPMTPRSMEHRIPVMATCPPAPRKVKRVPTTGKRRASSCFPVVRGPADFMVYLDAMLALSETVYVPDIVVGDLFGTGDQVKRLKLLPPPAYEP
ncbi:putative cyclin-dependent protein kinase inhibitor SMR [Helianthus anomalus]